MSKSNETQKPIRAGITHGDINGIGYEIIIKSLSDPFMLDFCIPIVYGTSKVASYHKKTMGNIEFNFNLVKKAENAIPHRTNIVNVTYDDVKVELGRSTPIAGELSYIALENAVEDLKNNQIDLLITAPINKKNIQSAEFKFSGHTEYLANRFDSPNYMMLMISNKMKIGLVTEHLRLSEVSQHITTDLVINRLNTFSMSLVMDFGIRKPRIAVLGLNPHSGDEGFIGDEENNIIIPAIDKLKEEGMLVYGPYPADGFFGAGDWSKFDGILAMYHDQGLIPFKCLSFNDGVNFTAGLPIIRTSPVHGTAYDIAGKNCASPDSFREAVFQAIDIFKNRKMYNELIKNPLKFTDKERDKGEN